MKACFARKLHVHHGISKDFCSFIVIMQGPIQMEHLPFEHYCQPLQWEKRDLEALALFFGQNYMTPTQPHDDQEVQYHDMPEKLKYPANHFYYLYT